MLTNIPTAATVRTIITQKSSLKTAADLTATPELSRANLYLIIDVISNELNKAVSDPTFVGNSVVVRIDSAILSRPIFTKITDYLTSQGYTPVVNVGGETLTISW